VYCHRSPRHLTDVQPRYLEPASEILPYLPRFAISMSIAEIREFFFDHCHGFSVMYEALASAEGTRFRKDCKAAGKDLCSWTVNSKEEMRQCARWGIKSIISDKPAQWRTIKQHVSLVLRDRHQALTLDTQGPRCGSKADPRHLHSAIPLAKELFHLLRACGAMTTADKQKRLAQEETVYLEREAGKFSSVVVPASTLRIAKPGDALL